MISLDRRAVLTAAAASAALGLTRSLEIVAPAAAQSSSASPLNPRELPFHRFKVGDIEVTTVFDGAMLREHTPGFVKNASTEEIKASLRAAGLPDAQLPNSYTITIVKVGDRTVMFDSGNGAGRSRDIGLLKANMKAAGIDPASLTAIAVTHFHPDHIYGLYAKDDAPDYADIEIVVPDAEYAFWADPGVIARLPAARQAIAKRVQASLPKWKNIRRVARGADVVPGITSVATPGHTPGHTSYLITAGSGGLMVLGDVTNIPPINMRNPGWHVMFDQDAPMAEATRRRVFDQAITDKLICTGYHWGMPGAGTIAKDGNGYVLIPVS